MISFKIGDPFYNCDYLYYLWNEQLNMGYTYIEKLNMVYPENNKLVQGYTKINLLNMGYTYHAIRKSFQEEIYQDS